MSVTNPYKQYKKTQIDTADQGQLILMLYDGAIRFINKAIELMPTRKIEEIHNNLLKAQDIITELMSSLNMEVGEISTKLFNIYMYINQRLIYANIKKTAEPLIEVKKYLCELREAWEIAFKNVQSKDYNQESGGINIAT